MILSLGALLLATCILNNDNTLHNVSFEYFEDTVGNMTIDEILDEATSAKFIPHENSSFSFGRSPSSWWIRFKIKDKEFGDIQNKYISIYNPTIAKANLYLSMQGSKNNYSKAVSGWTQMAYKDSERFFYPVFKIQDNVNYEQYGYINLYSTLTQNYNIKFLSGKEYSDLSTNTFMLIGILFGAIIAIIFHNAIIYVELKDKSYLYYILYILFMLLYQGNLSGVYSVYYMPLFYEKIMSSTVALSFIVMMLAVIFFKSFFETKNKYPYYNKLLNILLFMILSGLGLHGLKNHTLVNSYAHILSNIGAILMMYLAISLYKKGVRQARFFIIGWLFMILSIGVSFARHLTYIPNNNISVNITFIAVTINSIFLSAALVERVKSLQKEKEKALLLYKDAEVAAMSNEIAFLNAQIKPHFLYNALNVIATICVMNGLKARELILDLSGYLRHTFNFRDLSQFVSLEEELEFVEAYFRIEQARFGDRIQLKINLEEPGNVQLPPLVLQPLVENALKHGILSLSQTGVVEIVGRCEADAYILEVKDNGVGMSLDRLTTILQGAALKEQGVGIANIQKRMRNYYQTELEIQSEPNKGTCVRLKVPFSTVGIGGEQL